MKPRLSERGAVAAAYLMLAFVIGFPQEIVENPEKPPAKNAGRVLELKEVWRITDESGQFYFKYPYQLQIAGDGSIFLVDEGEFLHFRPDGNFIKNLFKKGEGPGEISSSFTYFIRGDELVIRDSMKRKVWSTDHDGNFKRGIEIPDSGYSSFIGIRNNDFVFAKTVFPPPAERTGKLMEIPHQIFLTPMDGKNERWIHTFHSTEFMSARAGRSWTPTIAVLSPDGKYLVGSYNTQYTIRVVDIDQGKLVLTFNRKYQRIKHPIDDFERKFNEQTGAPAMEFNPDVIGIKLVEDKIWVRTSTTDPKKGDLWDVFSMDGKFLDSVFLGPGRTLLRVEPEHIFVTEKAADETLVLVKYRMTR
jgi:outer membrane protein assembly factor BamB